MSREADNLKKKLRSKKTISKIPYDKGLSTGSTMLNLACTGRSTVGFLPGYYYMLVGDSNSGKTFLSLTCFAEACLNPAYSDYRLIYDNGEEGALMDVRKFFGQAVADRIEPPAKEDGYPSYSSTVEEFYFNVDDALAKGIPFIYVLDSEDSLTSVAEVKKFVQNKKAFNRVKEDDEADEMKGSYGDGKAKAHSSNLRRLIAPLHKSGSILLVVKQTRDNIEKFSFDKKTRSGGRALGFYATIEMWSSVKKALRKPYKGKERHTGNLCQVKIKRSRFTGRETVVEVPFYWSAGLDDTGSCVDYLIEEKHWSGGKGGINAEEFSFKGTREKLVAHIEENNLEKDLRLLVATVWADIESACEIRRKRRYE